MKESLQNRIDKLHSLIQAAECVIVGGGSGLSSAAGLTYSGERFTANFGDFIKRYDLTDMYSAAFYPFKTQEEKWAYWSRHILLNRWQPPALPLYQTLFELVGDKDYFVITTNVDAQFYKAGFAQDRIFAVQGDYGKLQCAKGCHDTLYDNQNLVRRMVSEQKDCRVPSLRSSPNAPCAAARWRSISVKICISCRTEHGMRQKNAMKIFMTGRAAKTPCYWSSASDTIRRRLSAFLLSGWCMKIKGYFLSA